MNKSALVQAIVHHLATEMELIANAAKSAHDEATHDDDRHENQFETPGLESSVLAEGQVKVAAELREAHDAFRSLALHDFAPGEPISLGALVEAESRGERTLYFVGPRAGGIEVNHEGRTVLVITPQSPLGRKLMGRRAGEHLPAEPGPAGRAVRILSVA